MHKKWRFTHTVLIEANEVIYTSRSHHKLHTSAFHKHKEQPIKSVHHNFSKLAGITALTGITVHWLSYESENGELAFIQYLSNNVETKKLNPQYNKTLANENALQVQGV